MPQDQSDEITVEQLDPRPVLSVRTTVPVAQLAAAQGEALGALWDHQQRHGAKPAGPPFVRNHMFGDTETDVEVGIPVAEAAAGEGRVGAGELPGGTVVSAWHLGPHDGLGEAYTRLQAWLREHDRKPRGAGWEVYDWIDPGQKPDPATWPAPSGWRTQLVQPIE